MRRSRIRNSRLGSVCFKIEGWDGFCFGRICAAPFFTQRCRCHAGLLEDRMEGWCQEPRDNCWDEGIGSGERELSIGIVD
jgi:hypothetical protein